MNDFHLLYKIKRSPWVLSLLLLLGSASNTYAQGHILKDPKRLSQIQETVECLYRWDLDKAEVLINNFSKGIEKHPVVPFAKAMVIYWRMAPINFSDTKQYPRHLELLRQTSDYADAMLEKDEEDIEAKFFKMASKSMVMKHLADAGQPMKALGEARDVYKLIKEGFDYKEEFIEFYFTTGIYNYYREYYPEIHPVYKPFAWVFQSGDKEKGLEQLKYTAKNATFTKAEAYSYLSHIYLRYERKQDQAILYARELSKTYPKNLFFTVQYTEILLITGKYEEATKYTSVLQKHTDPYYQAAGLLFEGIIHDRHKQDYAKATDYYLQTKAITDKMNYRFGLQKVYLYYGLSRVYSKQGDTDRAKSYYQLAKDHDGNGYLKTVEKPDF